MFFVVITIHDIKFYMLFIEGNTFFKQRAIVNNYKFINVFGLNIFSHSLPESPPDSSSEHPYSPQDGCEAPIAAPESIYTNLTQGIYKPTILSPILTDNLILGSHIVVTDQSNDQQILDNGSILQDNRLLVGGNGTTILSNRIIQDNLQNDPGILQDRMILPENNVSGR